MDYPVTLTPDDNGTILVSFVDWPAQTFGTDRADALGHAVDALATVIDAYIKEGQALPRPSKGKDRVVVPALLEAKIRLYETMRASKVTKAELGRRLTWHGPQVDRLLAMTHGSQLDQLEAAFSALGKRLVVAVEDADVGGVDGAKAPARRAGGTGPEARGARAIRKRPRRRARAAAR
jgi:antitoxin HicB